MKKEGQGPDKTRHGKNKYSNRLGGRKGRLRKRGRGNKTE